MGPNSACKGLIFILGAHYKFWRWDLHFVFIPVMQHSDIEVSAFDSLAYVFVSCTAQSFVIIGEWKRNCPVTEHISENIYEF